MKISVIMSWPDGFDFPLFRDTYTQLASQVHEVIVCFTQHGSVSQERWIRENLKGPLYLSVNQHQVSKYGGDWRNKSTNLMIDFSTGDYLLSLEQDFFIKDYPHFFNTVKNSKHKIVGFRETNRLHPAFLLIEKSIALRTSREFSVMGTGRDHFAHFSGQVLDRDYDTLEGLGLKLGTDWYHMRGLTENYFAPKPYYNLPTFFDYNHRCELVEPMSDYWRLEIERCKPTTEQKLLYGGQSELI